MLKSVFKNYIRAYSGLPKAAWFLSLVVLINRTGSIVLFFMTLYLTTQKNFTVAEAGQMISIYGVGALFGALLGGWFADRIGAINVQLYSLFLSGIGYITLGYIEQTFHIAILLFFIALVSEAFRPANATTIAEVTPPEKRARAYALNRLAVNVGVTIGPAIGGFLATVSYMYLFWIDGLTCLIASLFLWYFLDRLKNKSSISIVDKQSVVSSPWKDKIYLYMLLLLLIMGFAFVQIFNTWPLYLKTFYLLLEDKIGLLLALNAIMVAFLEMPLVHNLEKYNTIKIMGFGGFLLLFGFALLPLGNSMLFAVLSVTVWSTGEILVFPFMAGFISNRANERNRGKYMGMFTFNFALALVFGPAAGTWIYEVYGPGFLWYSIGVASIFVWLGFVVLYFLLQKEMLKK
jgi:MFS family permease